jgi:hypothetical protein
MSEFIRRLGVFVVVFAAALYLASCVHALRAFR